VQLFELSLECDAETAAEVVALAQSRGFSPFVQKLATYETEPERPAVSTKPNAKKDATKQAVSAAVDQAWASLLALIGAKQVNCLRVIKAHPEGVTSEQIGIELNRSTSSITGSLGGGLRPNIKKAGFGDDDETVIASKKIAGVWTYFPGPVLRSHDL
jgi:hypothetical protein